MNVEMRRIGSAGSAPSRERINAISGAVLDSALHIHRELGPGLL